MSVKLHYASAMLCVCLSYQEAFVLILTLFEVLLSHTYSSAKILTIALVLGGTYNNLKHLVSADTKEVKIGTLSNLNYCSYLKYDVALVFISSNSVGTCPAL